MSQGMGKRRLTLVILRKILLEETDSKHPLPLKDLIAMLAQRGCTVERKALYRDMKTLQQMGLDVVYRNGRGGGWFVRERVLEMAELKLLIDAVQAAQFITPARTDRLIARLTSLSSRHQAHQLRHQLYVDRRLKTDSDLVCSNAERLHGAMEEGRAVTFRYFTYNLAGQKVLRHGGMKYTVSPKALILNQERYYLAAWDHAKQEMRHYRVDKMQDVTRIGQSQRGPALETFDPADYAQRYFGMFRGKRARVTLRCQTPLAGVMRDRFGQEAPLRPDPRRGGFVLEIEVEISPQFYGWLFGLGGQVILEGPYWAVQEYRQYLQTALDDHRPFHER